MPRSNRFRPMLRLLEDRRTPATFTVTNLNDSGAGSLRQAVIDANSNGIGADAIQFNVPGGGTIVLSSQIAITGSVTIQGPGTFDITVSGNSASRIFAIGNPSALLDVAITNLTLTQAKSAAAAGGAIFNDGENLTIISSQITNNSATFGGGLSMTGSGKLVISNSNFSGNSATAGNGGAIDSGTGISGSISDSFISNNTASGSGGGLGLANANLAFNNVTIAKNKSGSNGGGVYSFFNTLTFNKSTIQKNIAGSDGGGLWLQNGSLSFDNSTSEGNTGGQGGGFYMTGQPANLLFRNATVSGNLAADGGGFRLQYCNTQLLLQNSTVTNNSASVNGGGINRFGGTGTIAVESTVIAGNFDLDNGSAPDVENNNTQFSYKNSAIGSASGITAKNDLGGNLAFGTNLKLGTLQKNGGLTLTHNPLAGSPLINTGSNPAGLKTDQRGFARVSGAAADIGAVEVQSNIVVTNTLDSGPGSLREAIFASNTDAGPATITFDAGVFATPQTINLSGGVLSISDAVVISGPTFGVTLKNTKASSRVIDTSGAAAQSPINLVRLTITGGSVTGSGGGILVGDESLTLTNSVVTGNSASIDGGGIYLNQSAARLVMAGSSVTNNTAGNNGGGVAVRYTSTVSITGSTISGNTATVDGGGIYFFSGGSLFLENSTLSGNKATQGIGGGLYFFGTVGGDGLTIRQSTISGNQSGGSGGGIVLPNFNGTLTVQNATITANISGNQGGGIARTSGGGEIALVSSIVAGNTATKSGPDVFSDGTVSMKTSAVGNGTGFSKTDLGGNLAFGTNLKLGPLQNNGGPTLTHTPLAGSPLIDAGSNPAGLTFDQRNQFRVIGPAIDIGAVEIRSTIVLNTADSGPGSLRQAIGHAASTPGGFTVTFDNSVFSNPQTITLTSGEIPIGGSVTVNGPAARVTVSGNNVSRIFNHSLALPSTQVTLNNLRLINGNTVGNGGAILAGDESLFLNNCLIENNTAEESGGAIAFVETGPGTLTIHNSILSKNKAGGDGGAIHVITDAVTITHSSVLGNIALNNRNGGGVHLQSGGKLSVRGSTFNGNFAGDGGGIWMGKGGSLLIENSNMSNNVATSYGGGLVYNGSVGPEGAVVRNTTIAQNSAGNFGGGLGVGNLVGNFAIQNSTITGNNAPNGNGGGISFYQAVGKLAIESSIVAQNASPNGPDIQNQNSPLTISRSAIGSGAGFVFTDLGNNLTFGLDLKLGPLQNNGGPTLTRLPLPGSPLIGAGSNPAGLTTDQRGPGYARRRDGAVDIGAVEARSAFTLVLFGGGFVWQRAGDSWSPVTEGVASISEPIVDSAGRSIYALRFTDGRLSEYRSDGALTPLSSGVALAEPGMTATYVTFTAGGLWRRDRDSGNWTNLTGASVTGLSVGTDANGQDLVGVIFSGNFAWTYQNLGGAAWTNVAGNVAQLGVGFDGRIAVLFNGGFLWQNRIDNSTWSSVASDVAAVTAGSAAIGGRQFNVSFNGGFVWSFTDDGWASVASGVSRVGRANGGLYTVLFVGGFLWQRDAAGWSNIAGNVV